MVISNKNKSIKKLPQYIPIRTWLKEVQEAGYALGQIKTKTATTPRAKSRPFLKEIFSALEMRAHTKNSDIEEILSDITKGERNRKPTEKHYSIPCPSFGLGRCIKMLCVTKKW